MSIKGFEVGGVQDKYDYESLDNIPANLVQDANYVHTDNNYTNADKTKLSGIEAQANKTTIDATLTHSGQAADAKATGDAISALNAQVIASMPHDTASGSIASFPDGAAMPVRDLSVDIEPVQAGSGDPSPDNIRPITGWTGATVTRTGKNLVKPKYGGRTNNGVTYTTNADGSISLSGTASGSSYFASNYGFNTAYMCFLKAGTYTLSGAPNEYVRVYGGLWTVGGTLIANAAQDTGSGSTFTVSEDFWFNPQIYVVSGTNTTGIVVKMQVESGSQKTSYEAYQGQTYTIDLDGTRYGGTLDVTSGKLTVDRAKGNLFGQGITVARASTAVSGKYRFHIQGITGILEPTTTGTATSAISNVYKAISADAGYAASETGFAIRSSYIVHVYDEAHATDSADDFKAYLQTEGAYIVYPLATPIEVDLTPTEITTLLGTNNIFADCGDTTVDYYADTTLFVNKKIAAAVAALS